MDKDKLTNKAVDSLRSCTSDMILLQINREDAIKAYMSEPYGNEIEGRSQFVGSEVFNTIEWILPSLMRIFWGGSDVVKLSPVGPEDDGKDKAMQDLIKFQITKGFNGFLAMYDWFKDALLYKLGIMKYCWVKETQYKNKEYTDLSDAEYQAIMFKVAQGKFEITKHDMVTEREAQFDEFGNEIAPAVMSHNLKGREVKEISKPLWQPIPPEEFVFDVRAAKLEDSFCAHKKKVHRNYLKAEYGVKDADIIDAYNDLYQDVVKQERFKDLGGTSFLMDTKDDEFVYIYECFFNDYDKDGKPIPIKLCLMGDRSIELDENKYGKPPFRDLSAIRLTHRIVGRSFYDLVGEIQKLKSGLIRAVLDNIYFQNNGTRAVNPEKMNIDDLFTQNVPGGVFRTINGADPGGSYLPIPVTPLAPQTMKMMEYADSGILENRTGITRYNQGLDANSLNKTATGISQIMGAAQQRIELIARLFAESGVKGLFQDTVNMNLEYFDKDVAFKVNESDWMKVNPADIDGDFDIAIDVALGTGSKDLVANQLMQMLNIYLKGLVQTGIARPENITELVKAIWENWGYNNVEKFVTEAQNVLPQGQGPIGPGGQPLIPGAGSAGLPAGAGIPTGEAPADISSMGQEFGY